MEVLKENCILNKDRKIGYHIYSSLIFKEHGKKNSINFYFKFDLMDSLDLYLILMSYLRYYKLIPLRIVFTLSRSGFTRIFSKNLTNLQKMSYFQFSEWWEFHNIYDSGSEIADRENYWTDDHVETCEIYIEYEMFSVINFCNHQDIKISDFSKLLKPDYPWKNELINGLKIYIDFSTIDCEK